MTDRLFDGKKIFKPYEDSEIKGIRFISEPNNTKFQEFMWNNFNVKYEIFFQNRKTETGDMKDLINKSHPVNFLYNNILYATNNFEINPKDYCFLFSIKKNGLVKLNDSLKDETLIIGDEKIKAKTLYNQIIERIDEQEYITKGRVYGNKEEKEGLFAPKLNYKKFSKENPQLIQKVKNSNLISLINGFSANEQSNNIPCLEIVLNEKNYNDYYNNYQTIIENTNLHQYQRLISIFKEHFKL